MAGHPYRAAQGGSNPRQRRAWAAALAVRTLQECGRVTIQRV